MELAPLQRHVVASDIQPERLAGNTQLSQSEKIGEASRQFESILLKQILDSAQKTVIKSKYSDTSTSASIYHDMVTNQLADSISKSGALGLAKTFSQQLNRPHAQDATTAAANVPAAVVLPTTRTGVTIHPSEMRAATHHPGAKRALHPLHLKAKHT